MRVVDPIRAGDIEQIFARRTASVGESWASRVLIIERRAET